MLESTVAFNGFTFNDQSMLKANLSVSPYYCAELTSVDGLLGADVSYEEHPIPGAIGVKSGDVFRRARTITLTGILWARGLQDLRTGQWAMAQAMADRAAHPLTWTPWNLGFSIYLTCRVYQDLVMPEQQPDRKMARQFVVSLRADDPRTYKTSDNSLYPTWQSGA